MAQLDSAKSWILVVMELAVALAMYPVITGLLTDANITGAGASMIGALIPLFLVLAILWRTYNKLF
jgi:hypothetical protein